LPTSCAAQAASNASHHTSGTGCLGSKPIA
jgi:hypothetical protein